MGRPRVRLALERIVQVGMSATEDLNDGGSNVEWKEKHAPPLVLLHVDMLVNANARQNDVINSENDVAEGDRHEARRWREARENAKQATASDFDGAVGKAKRCAGAHGEGGEYRSDGARR